MLNTIGRIQIIDVMKSIDCLLGMLNTIGRIQIKMQVYELV